MMYFSRTLRLNLRTIVLLLYTLSIIITYSVQTPYLATAFGGLTSVLGDLAALSCDTSAPTSPPTPPPTLKPTTPQPTAKPTASFGCNADELAVCGIPGNVSERERERGLFCISFYCMTEYFTNLMVLLHKYFLW